MTKKTIEFISKKGSCEVGYIGTYPKEEADSLIKRGFAKVHVPSVKAEKPISKSVKKGD